MRSLYIKCGPKIRFDLFYNKKPYYGRAYK